MEGPPEKKLCLHPISPQFCLICNKHFGKKDKTIKSPTVQGLRTICNVAKIRSDDASKRIAAFEQQILAGEIQVSYHKICRASYTSSSHIRSESLSVYTLAVSPSLGGSRQHKRNKQKQWGFHSVLPAMTRDPAEFGWHCWSNTTHPPPSSTTYVAS